jgi:hypothetical protein
MLLLGVAVLAAGLAACGRDGSSGKMDGNGGDGKMSRTPDSGMMDDSMKDSGMMDDGMKDSGIMQGG